MPDDQEAQEKAEREQRQAGYDARRAAIDADAVKPDSLAAPTEPA